MWTLWCHYRRHLAAWYIVVGVAGLIAFLVGQWIRSDGKGTDLTFTIEHWSEDLDGVLANSEHDVSLCIHNSGRCTLRVVGLSQG